MAVSQEAVSSWLASNPTATAEQIYSAAQAYGATGAQIDAAMGNSAGTADAYVSNHGWQSLGSPAAATSAAGGGIMTGGGLVNQTADQKYKTIGDFANSSTYAMNDLKGFWDGNKSVRDGYGTWDNYLKSATDSSTSKQFEDVAKYYGTPNAGTKQAIYDPWEPYVSDLTKQQPKPSAATGQAYPFNFTSAVDAPTETIEGRIKNLLDQNNPVIRQAGDRAMAQFAQRGLLNSSMAIEAANEAMISKAIEIAGPDAATYFQNRTNNVNWQNKAATSEQQQGYDLQKLDFANTLNNDQKAVSNKLAMQENYKSAVQNIQTLYAQQIQQIQSSQMDSADKQAALDNLVTTRDNSIRLMTATYQQFPDWQSEWSSLVSMLPTA